MKIRQKIAGMLTAMVCSVSIFAGGVQPLIADAEAGTYGDLSYSTVDSDGNGTDDYVEITDCDESATEVDIPGEIDGLPVTSIGDSAFYYCKSLESITIPDSVTSIGDSSFYYCKSLSSITIPDSLTLIGDSVFRSCDSLASITIPGSVTSIGDSAFGWCSGLVSITIPDSVTSIGASAFCHCTSLESITIPDSVILIRGSAFYGCDSLISINVSENNSSFTSINGVLFNKEESELIAYPAGKTDTEYIIPESVTSIGNSAFKYCDSLVSITIPGSVTSIGNSAFYWCTDLESIIIPDSVTSIGDSTFYYCTSLESITIKNPECEIYDSEHTITNSIINEDFNGIIYGYANSTAHAYAEKYNRTFAALDEEPPVTTPGDISGNGKIDLYDAIEICKSIMGMRTFTDEENEIADFDGNGVVDLYDAIGIAKELLPK